LDHGNGGFAEYVSVPGDVMSSKPANLSFEEAAAVPMAAVTAFQGLRHHGEIQPVQKVLINGASGGVGTFAVQIAKSYGPQVTGVTSTRNIDLVRSLGADHASTTGRPTSPVMRFPPKGRAGRKGGYVPLERMAGYAERPIAAVGHSEYSLDGRTSPK
jgi:NADPH:quinone reductase-like Zn-dependent oxidoreductase